MDRTEDRDLFALTDGTFDLVQLSAAVDALPCASCPTPRSPRPPRAARAAALHAALSHRFTVAIDEVVELDRSPMGKLEELVALVAR